MNMDYYLRLACLIKKIKLIGGEFMKKKLWGLFFKMCLLCFVFYITYVMTVQQPIIQSKYKEIKELTQLIEEAENENLDLREKLILVESNEYIEKEARKKLGLIKPGEKIFVDIKD